MLGDYESAAKRLAVAPGLGWADPEHPGHLLFRLFGESLDGGESHESSTQVPLSARDMDPDESEPMQGS